MTITTQSRPSRPHTKPDDISDARTDQWPDVIEESSDQSQPSASYWVGRTPHASDQVRMNIDHTCSYVVNDLI